MTPYIVETVVQYVLFCMIIIDFQGKERHTTSGQLSYNSFVTVIVDARIIGDRRTGIRQSWMRHLEYCCARRKEQLPTKSKVHLISKASENKVCYENVDVEYID